MLLREHSADQADNSGAVGKDANHVGAPADLLVQRAPSCEEAGLNLAWRWSLGYELDEALTEGALQLELDRHVRAGAIQIVICQPERNR